MTSMVLHEALEELENAIQSLREIEKEQDGNHWQLERLESNSSLIAETQLFELNKKAKHLESKLLETLATVKAKEQKVWELELLLSNTNFPKLESSSTHPSALLDRKEEVKSELEPLIMKKMEAEIEYLILRTSINWKLVSEDHIALLNELRYLAGDQEEIMLKLRDAEDKTFKLNERTDKLGTYSKELVGMEYVLRLQQMFCKFSFYFIFQLMLLCIAFGLFLMKRALAADGVRPT